MQGKVCKIKNFMPSTHEVENDNIASLSRVVTTANLINLGVPHINFCYFGGHISTFCPANMLKTECVVHWTAGRETIGL